MTWEYKITENSNLSVYDHNGDHVTTVMNGGSGVSVPDDVLGVMGEELDSRGWDLSSSYVRETIKDALTENIEEQA